MQQVRAAGRGSHLRCYRRPRLARLSLYTTHGGEEHECSDIGDSSSRLCGEVVFGGIAGGVVVEGLGDSTQRLGMVEDAHRGTSSQAAIKHRRPQGAAGGTPCVCLRIEAVSKAKLRPVHVEPTKQSLACIFWRPLRVRLRVICGVVYDISIHLP